MTFIRVVLSASAVLCACAAPVSAAARAFEEVPIPGGTAALAKSLGLDGPPDRARFLAEIARIVYESPDGKNLAVAAKQRVITAHLDAVGRFQKALAAVQTRDGGVTLATAGRKEDQNRLKEFLALVGLKLREKNKKFSVESSGNKEASERVSQLAALNIDLQSLAARLNAGEEVRIDVPSETVPVPLDAKTWSSAVFHRTVTRDELFAAITLDGRAALVAYGLSAMDDETVAFVEANPDFLGRLYDDHAAATAAFGDTIRIHAGRAVPPGGVEGIRAWEAVLGEPISKPDRFFRELLGQSDGRVALVYEALTYVDASHVRFAYGGSIADPEKRLDQFKAVVGAARDRDEWRVGAAPFSRPVYDVAMMLARVRVKADGTPAAPNARVFWHQVFESAAVPDDPSKLLRNLHDDGEITAGWLASALGGENRALRADRLDQLSFGQRAFGTLPEAQLGDALVAVRSLARFRMLMLAIERVGIRDPRVYADAARRAEQISSFDLRHRRVALGTFQAGIAVVDRFAKVRVVDTAAAERLLKGLVALPPDEHGRYSAAVRQWIIGPLAAAAQCRADAEIDRELVRAASGVPDASPTKITWEGRSYRVDIVGPEQTRLDRTLEKMRPTSIRSALDLAEITSRLSAAPSLDDVKTAGVRLRSMLADVPKAEKGAAPSARTALDPEASPAEVLARVIQSLSRITQPKDVKRASAAAVPLSALSDEWLADALMAVAYAFDLGNPDGSVLMGGDVSRRHDFGLDSREDEERVRAPWSEPRIVAAAGAPWHVRGSVLGLDVALATNALRRLDTGEMPAKPVLMRPDTETFTHSVALVNPFALRDSDRDAIVDSIERGRARVIAATTVEAWEKIAADARLDGWRRRSGAWMLTADRSQLASLFSFSELYYLGSPAPDLPIEQWSMSAEVIDGCLCKRAAPPGQWLLASGRPQIGGLAAFVADLNLLIAQALRARSLPARLARGVLATAMQDLIDTARPFHPNDWLTLVRAAQSISEDRIDDYVAALTAGGPLVNDRPTSGGGRQ